MFVGVYVGVKDGSDSLVFVVVVDCSSVLFFIGKVCLRRRYPVCLLW